MKNIYFKTIIKLLYRNIIVLTSLYLIGAFSYYSLEEPLKLITEIPNYTNGSRLAIFLFFVLIQGGAFKNIKDEYIDQEKKKAEAKMFDNRKKLSQEARDFLLDKRIKGSSLTWLSDFDNDNFYSENDVVDFLESYQK